MINNFFFCVAAALTGGFGSPFLTLVAVPIAVMASRYCFRAVLVTVAATLSMTGLAGLADWLGGTDTLYPHVVVVLSFLATFFGITVVVFTFQSADIHTREQANTDVLTGLPSRKALDVALRHLFDRPATSACVLMCDVDHFKAINDTFGHDRGDQVLRGVAEVLRTALRPHEQVFRYGGEEFIVLIEGLTNLQAAAVATRICAAVAGATIHESPVTISVGVAVGDAADGSGGLVLRADAAMYAAKRAGRNRVIVWGVHLQQPDTSSSAVSDLGSMPRLR